MHTRLLGTAAGGGFPQWNCSCPPCRAVRSGSDRCVPRTQSSIAVSADGIGWTLCNASPDILRQIEAFDALHPADGSVRRFDSVLLTDAELDHTLGLLLLREGRGLEVHATASVHETLLNGTGVLRTLEAYCPVTWRPVVPGVEVDLGGGLSYRAFEVPTSKRPRFDGTPPDGRVVGYRFTDAADGTSLVYLPCVQQLTDEVLAELGDCTTLLVDGSFWRDDEMPSLGLANKTARDMGHQPIDGPDGTLALLAPLSIDRTLYIHINNTNPILLEDSPERTTLARHGVEVASDGMELVSSGDHDV